jgi:hypothetical protein
MLDAHDTWDGYDEFLEYGGGDGRGGRGGRGGSVRRVSSGGSVRRVRRVSNDGEMQMQARAGGIRLPDAPTGNETVRALVQPQFFLEGHQLVGLLV